MSVNKARAEKGVASQPASQPSARLLVEDLLLRAELVVNAVHSEGAVLRLVAAALWHADFVARGVAYDGELGVLGFLLLGERSARRASATAAPPTEARSYGHPRPVPTRRTHLQRTQTRTLTEASCPFPTVAWLITGGEHGARLP